MVERIRQEVKRLGGVDAGKEKVELPHPEEQGGGLERGGRCVDGVQTWNWVWVGWVGGWDLRRRKKWWE